MGIKKFKPITPGRRFMTVVTFEDITRTSPERSLVEPLLNHAGRNGQGRVTTRHRGGGHKRRYRIIDFKRNKDGVTARVAQIEYDPNRSARIALLHYRDGEKRYILAPVGLGVGDVVASGPDVEIKPGNCLPLRAIPVGSTVHNLELHVGCRATIGQIGNLEHESVSIGKAGRTRWLRRRPHVRGVVMDPSSHPHGGGEGKSPIGMPGPVTPWGKPTLGYKTRKTKPSDKFIVKRRK